MARACCDTHASIGCQRAGGWSPHPPNADRPTRRRARRWGDLSSPWGEELGQGPHGPGSFPPACTQLSFQYNDFSPNSLRVPESANPPPIPVPLPATFGVRWRRSAMLVHPGLAARPAPSPGATAMAWGTSAGPLPVRRNGESTLALIERFALHSTESRYRVSKTRSRVSMVWQRAFGSAAPADGSGAMRAKRRTENLG